MTIGAANSGFPPPVDRVVRPRVDDDADLSGETSSESADEQPASGDAAPKPDSSTPQPGPYSPPPAPGSLLNIKI